MTENNPTAPADFDILKVIIPRVWKPGPLAESVLALEVIDGPYKGVVYTYSNFKVLPHDIGYGWQPVKFEIRIFKQPKDFREDEEGWQEFAREVVIAWLQSVARQDLQRIISAEPVGGIH